MYSGHGVHAERTSDPRYPRPAATERVYRRRTEGKGLTECEAVGRQRPGQVRLPGGIARPQRETLLSGKL